MTVLLSALIALLIASFAAVPPVNASDVSKTTDASGGGYRAIISSGEITSATAEWIEPVITCQPSLAERQVELTLLGIAGSSNVPGSFGVGVAGVCDQGSSTPQYFANANSPSFTVGLSVTVKPGDVLSVSLTRSLSTGAFTATLTDLSTGQSASANLGSTLIPLTAISWIIQRKGVALAQFSVPIRFSNCTVTVSGQTFTISRIETIVQATLVGPSGNTLATTSSLSRAGSSFKVTWVSST